MRIGHAMIFAIPFLFILSVRSSPSVAASAPDACALLTQAQVSAALGVSVGAGQHAGPVVQMCQWTSAKAFVQLDIMGQMGSLSPTDRFNNAKRPVGGITKTPTGGVGDDAYYITSVSGTSLNVRKGNSALEIRVRGVPADQIKAVEKSLAQEAVLKL
jgi:hypothetical protein